MNIDNNLILIKGEDKTDSVESWRFDKFKPVVFITYLSKYGHLKDDSPLSGAKQLQFFGRHCRVVYKSGYRELVPSSSVRIVESAFHVPESKNCFEYLKQIAIRTGLVTAGHNILAHSHEKIKFVREDSVLAAFLSGKYDKEHVEKNTSIVYPFGFNLSQKKAVDNALCNPISIIEGPPGTGKTQTILNIIANAVMRGESVAVVSSNNSATANVLEKLKKYGVDFIAAPLGSSANREAFIESQNPTLPDMRAWREATNDLSTMREDEVELDKMLNLQNELSAITAEQDTLEKEFAHFGDYYATLKLEGDMPQFSKRTSAAKILAFVAEYELLLQQRYCCYYRIKIYRSLFSYNRRKVQRCSCAFGQNWRL